MIMCEYCRTDTLTEPLITFNVNCGIMGKIRNDVSVLEKINLDGSRWFLSSELNTGIGVKEKRIKINYCPICGRKLEKEGG